MNFNDQLLARQHAIFLMRMDRSVHATKTFMDWAREAASAELAKRAIPTPNELERIAAHIVSDCFATVLVAESVPSRVELRAAARAAGSKAVADVMGPSPQEA